MNKVSSYRNNFLGNTKVTQFIVCKGPKNLPLFKQKWREYGLPIGYISRADPKKQYCASPN